MQNLYFSFQNHPTSGNFPDQEKQKLLGYSDMVQGIRDQLTPDKDLQKIDETIIHVFLKDLRFISSGMAHLQNNYNSYPIDGVNRVYNLLKTAITQLNVALDILGEIERVGLGRRIRTEYYECLNECEVHLAEILQEFKDMLLP